MWSIAWFKVSCMACRWFANYNFCDRCGVLHRVSKFPAVFVGRIIDRCDVLHRVSKFPTVFGVGLLTGVKYCMF